jgi:hypothetical protein
MEATLRVRPHHNLDQLPLYHRYGGSWQQPNWAARYRRVGRVFRIAGVLHNVEHFRSQLTKKLHNHGET